MLWFSSSIIVLFIVLMSDKKKIHKKITIYVTETVSLFPVNEKSLSKRHSNSLYCK